MQHSDAQDNVTQRVTHAKQRGNKDAFRSYCFLLRYK